MFHGYMALADRFRTERADLALVEELDAKITLKADGLAHAAGDVIDWFDYDNPEWQALGILVRPGAGDHLPAPGCKARATGCPQADGR